MITLVLYFGYDNHWNDPLTLHEAIDIPDFLKPFVPDIRINLFEIAYMSPEQVQSFRSDFRIVADYFVQKRMNNDYVPPKDRITHIEAVLQLLSVMANDRRFEDIYESATQDERKEIRNMCDVLDRVEMRGVEQGKIIGAVEMLRDMGIDDHSIVEKLMDKYGLTQEDAEKYVLQLV